jgi:two-component system response regulator FixJ
VPGTKDDRIVYFIDSDGSDSEGTARLLRSLGIAARPVAGGVAGLDQLRDREPGCVLIDIDADGIDAAAFFGALPERCAALPVVVISAQAEMSAVVDVMRLGACDFISKPLDRETVAASLTRVFERLRDETAAYRRRQCALAAIADLTHREQDILRGLVAGRANKTSAHDLGLSIRTVEMHRAHLMARLGVSSLAQVIRLVFEAGLNPEAMAMAPAIPQSA